MLWHVLRFIGFYEGLTLYLVDGAPFVDSSLGGHLGCVHLVATVTNATLDIGVQCLFAPLPSVLLGVSLGVELLYLNFSALHFPRLHLNFGATGRQREGGE